MISVSLRREVARLPRDSRLQTHRRRCGAGNSGQTNIVSERDRAHTPAMRMCAVGCAAVCPVCRARGECKRSVSSLNYEYMSGVLC